VAFTPVREWLINMQDRKKERWVELAEQAANEQDPEKLQQLALEIDRLLEEKRRRLTGKKPPSDSAHE
jgi:hypothetical protein